MTVREFGAMEFAIGRCPASTRTWSRLRRGGSAEELTMSLISDFRETAVERIRHAPAFAKALPHEAATPFLNGEPEAARLILPTMDNLAAIFEALRKKLRVELKARAVKAA